MYQESRSVFRLELLLNILQLLRGYVQSPLHRQTFGGSHLHQSKLVFPALHFSTFAAHQFQLFAQLPIVAFVFAPDLMSCQFAFAIGKIIKTLVLARSAALLHRDAISVYQHHIYVTTNSFFHLKSFFIRVIREIRVRFLLLGLPSVSVVPISQRSLV